MTSFEVDPPEFLVVKTELAKAVPLELVFENGMFINSQSQIAEQLVTSKLFIFFDLIDFKLNEVFCVWVFKVLIVFCSARSFNSCDY